MTSEKRINASTKITSESYDDTDYVAIEAGQDYGDYVSRLGISEVKTLIEYLNQWLETREFTKEPEWMANNPVGLDADQVIGTKE